MRLPDSSILYTFKVDLPGGGATGQMEGSISIQSDDRRREGGLMMNGLLTIDGIDNDFDI